MTAAHPPVVRVGDALVDEGAITRVQLKQALADQKSSGLMLGELLVQQGVISTATMTRTLARCLGVKGCQLRHGLIDNALLKLIGEDEARRPIVLFLDEEVRPFFRADGVRGSRLADVHARAALFADLRRRSEAGLHDVVDDLEALCEQRAQLETQRTMHHWMHGWLLVHVPLSWLLVVLTAVMGCSGLTEPSELLREGSIFLESS